MVTVPGRSATVPVSRETTETNRPTLEPHTHPGRTPPMSEHYDIPTGTHNQVDGDFTDDE